MAHQAGTFEAMPAELHIIVLSNMATPEDARATIQASPAALRAFLTGPERIYAMALETCLAPEIFRELLAILNAPDHNTWLVTPLLTALQMHYFNYNTNPSNKSNRAGPLVEGRPRSEANRRQMAEECA